MIFNIDHRMFAHTCDLIRIADTLDATEETLHSAISCSAPFPIGRDYIERSFHHTPDVGMGDPGRPFCIFLRAAEFFVPTPAMRVKIAGVSYGIRAINVWTHANPQFKETISFVKSDGYMPLPRTIIKKSNLMKLPRPTAVSPSRGNRTETLPLEDSALRFEKIG